MSHEFVVVGRTRNLSQILAVCQALKAADRTYYCFAENEHSHAKAGLNLHDHPDTLAQDFESHELNSDTVRQIFADDLAGVKNAEKLILVLPAGNSAHIEAGIAYGLGKTCYALGAHEKTDSLYLIFQEIFPDLAAFKKFLRSA